MKEPKHTRGPWRTRRLTVLDDDYGYMPGCVIDGIDWARLADVHCSGDDAVLGDTTRCEANAHLIATAPEMRELLEEIARGPYEDSDCRSLCEAYAARARALLDKARGVHEAAE